MATLLQVRRSGPAPSQGQGDTLVVRGTNLLGRRIGSYTVLGELGQGGMGCVYLAEHSLIGRKAAIKVLNPDIASDPEVVSRFFTEARAVNDIRHPNIVEVTDFGEFDSLHCIVMEFLEGETLAARLTRIRTFDERSVVRIMKQCTSALGAAHERGLVHRDIKPENIFLRSHPDYPDFVKLLDFGIAKLLGAETTVGHHTQTGSVLGTPSYMSPEQCLGEAALDTRSDVYSLGVVIYQMITGLLPFTGDTLGRLIVCHVNEAPVPPRVVNPAISRAMNDLVLRALEKKPKDRFQSARDMRDALERLLAPLARVETPRAGIDTGTTDTGATSAPPRSHRSEHPTQARVLTAARPDPGSGAVRSVQSSGSSASGRTTPVTSIDVRPSGPPLAAGDAARGGELTTRLTEIVRGHLLAGQITLPDLPGPTIRCIELARDGRLGFTDAANIISEAPSIRSRIMRLANSGAFPSLMPATTLPMAIGRLGTQGLCDALVELAARETLEGHQPRVKEAMRRIWPHALGTATLTAELCQVRGRGSHVDNAYLAGLLADVGSPVIGAALVQIEQQMLRAGNRSPIPDPVFLGVMEACGHIAGGMVARRWEMPVEVVEAVESSRGWNAVDPNALSNAVRFAGLFAGRLGLTVGAMYNGPEAERAFGEGRALLKIEELALRRISHGFKERVMVLAGIRG